MQVTNNPSDVGMRMHLASLMWCGLLLNEANWILYLLLIIVGPVFFTKVLARRARGQYYATIAQFYPKILRLRARIDENYEHSPFGQRWAIVWKFVAASGALHRDRACWNARERRRGAEAALTQQ